MQGLRPDIDERHRRGFMTWMRGEPLGWGIADRAAVRGKESYGGRVRQL